MFDRFFQFVVHGTARSEVIVAAGVAQVHIHRSFARLKMSTRLCFQQRFFGECRRGVDAFAAGAGFHGSVAQPAQEFAPEGFRRWRRCRHFVHGLVDHTCAAGGVGGLHPLVIVVGLAFFFLFQLLPAAFFFLARLTLTLLRDGIAVAALRASVVAAAVVAATLLPWRFGGTRFALGRVCFLLRFRQ